MPMWGRGPGMAPEYAYPGGLMACCSTQVCKLRTNAEYTISVSLRPVVTAARGAMALNQNFDALLLY